jgi:Bacterial Ig domain
MLKEIILAIIIGALLGFGLMGGYLAINNKKKNDDNPPVITSPAPVSDSDSNQSPNSSENKNIIIDSVEDYDIVDNDDLTLSGNTTPNSTIVVTLDDQILDDVSDKKGEFTFDLSLESGLNIIKITVIDEQNNQSEKELHITYSTAEI